MSDLVRRSDVSTPGQNSTEGMHPDSNRRCYGGRKRSPVGGEPLYGDRPCHPRPPRHSTRGRAHHGRPWTPLQLARPVRGPAGSGGGRAGNTKTDVVVPVVGLVPVAICRAQVPWIVVPGTAAQHTRRGTARLPGTPARAGTRKIMAKVGGHATALREAVPVGSNQPPANRDCRSRHVSA